MFSDSHLHAENEIPSHFSTNFPLTFVSQCSFSNNSAACCAMPDGSALHATGIVETSLKDCGNFGMRCKAQTLDSFATKKLALIRLHATYYKLWKVDNSGTY